MCRSLELYLRTPEVSGELIAPTRRRRQQQRLTSFSRGPDGPVRCIYSADCCRSCKVTDSTNTECHDGWRVVRSAASTKLSPCGDVAERPRPLALRSVFAACPPAPVRAAGRSCQPQLRVSRQELTRRSVVPPSCPPGCHYLLTHFLRQDYRAVAHLAVG